MMGLRTNYNNFVRAGKESPRFWALGSWHLPCVGFSFTLVPLLAYLGVGFYLVSIQWFGFYFGFTYGMDSTSTVVLFWIVVLMGWIPTLALFNGLGPIWYGWNLLRF